MHEILNIFPLLIIASSTGSAATISPMTAMTPVIPGKDICDQVACRPPRKIRLMGNDSREVELSIPRSAYVSYNSINVRPLEVVHVLGKRNDRMLRGLEYTSRAVDPSHTIVVTLVREIDPSTGKPMSKLTIRNPFPAKLKFEALINEHILSAKDTAYGKLKVCPVSAHQTEIITTPSLLTDVTLHFFEFLDSKNAWKDKCE